ncbi:hypothetical protein L3X39_02845 [Sabulilitoribacter multivorans]|uniref:Uncharacterized protein n=1 Tax=Flaviramulus multivorans TaxID=1304750 RepID=A0ABS9IG14_9FLAO|nr:hypothetical protein [Flaviramulus multivorans]MCF7559560.1 hypothetical protein [Flaviramulus multivorans]
MKSDSFENFGRYKEIINQKLTEFISTFENSSEQIKQLIHFQSTISVSREIIRFNNSKAHALKDKLIEYFEIVKELDFSIDENDHSAILKQKVQSRKRYREFIYPIGSFLMWESGFSIRKPIEFYIFIGIIIDSIIYYFLSKDFVPLGTIVFIGIGVLSHKKRNNKQKVFGLYK